MKGPRSNDIRGNDEPVPDCATGPFGRLSWTFREILGMFRAPGELFQPCETESEREASSGDDNAEGTNPSAEGSLPT
jgi:hypothetical protein